MVRKRLLSSGETEMGIRDNCSLNWEATRRHTGPTQMLQPSDWCKWLATLAVAGLLAVWMAWPARAASPREDLLRLVPADVGFCLLVQDLRSHGDALLHSPLVRRLEQTPLGRKLAGAKEAQPLSDLDRLLQNYFQISSKELRDEILGDAIVFAYRPGPPGKPEGEQGICLVHARNEKLLAQLVQRINKLQSDTGDLKSLETCGEGAQVYYRRIDQSGTNYYFLRGPILALSPQEDWLRQVLDRLASAGPNAESPVTREFRLLGMESALAGLWINPRTFDAQLQHHLTNASATQAVTLRTLQRYWQAVDGLGLACHLDEQLRLSLAVRGRREQLPQAAQQFLATAAARSELWNCIPANALVAFAGRIDVPAAAGMLSEFIPEEGRQPIRAALDATCGALLGPHSDRELTTHVGPEFGLWVLPPAGDRWVPTTVAALRVRSAPSVNPADRTLLSGLKLLASLAVFQHNAGKPGSLRLQTTLHEGEEITSLVNPDQFPAGFQPSFGLHGNYLVLATSLEAVRSFQPPPSAARVAGAREPVPLLRVSLRGVHQYVSKNLDILARHSADKNQISTAQAREQLVGLVEVLQFFEQVEITQRAFANGFALQLRVQLVQPLK